MIESISLEKFRNFNSFASELAPITLITGPNGSGKTSILEAIALFGGHRFTKTLKELIQWGETYARIEVGLQENTYNRLSLVIQQKTIRVFGDNNGLIMNEVYERVPSVYFSPRAVSLLEDSPSSRRRFIDQLLITLSPDYKESLRQYAHTLKQRNAALAQGYISQHSVWEDALSEHGAYLTLVRNWCLRELSRFFEPGGLVSYHMSPKSGSELLPDEGKLAENLLQAQVPLQQFLREKWHGLREREIRVGFTLMGPQRDDWAVMQQRNNAVEPINVGIFGSRGEQRMAVITLQHAALSLLEHVLPVKPIWILDDVFSELDTQHHSRITAIVDMYQTCISAANPDYAGVGELRARADVKHIALTPVQ